jgi:hypothetical protein
LVAANFTSFRVFRLADPESDRFDQVGLIGIRKKIAGDRDLPPTLVNFVSSHLQLKNSVERAQAEMDAAAKTAQAEARAKAKTPGKKDPPKQEDGKSALTAKPVEIAKPEPAKTASLFDAPAPVAATPASAADAYEEEDILAELEEDGQMQDEDELDEVA